MCIRRILWNRMRTNGTTQVLGMWGIRLGNGKETVSSKSEYMYMYMSMYMYMYMHVYMYMHMCRHIEIGLIVRV